MSMHETTLAQWQLLRSVHIKLPRQGGIRPVHIIPGQLIASGRLTGNGVNFSSVHGLTPVTVHMSFRSQGQVRNAGYLLYNTG